MRFKLNAYKNFFDEECDALSDTASFFLFFFIYSSFWQQA